MWGKKKSLCQLAFRGGVENSWLFSIPLVTVQMCLYHTDMIRII